jgi:hypothetical protein
MLASRGCSVVNLPQEATMLIGCGVISRHVIETSISAKAGDLGLR